MFPEIVIPSTGIDASQGKDVFGTGFSPEHTGLFASRPDDGSAADFDGAGSDERRHQGGLTPFWRTLFGRDNSDFALFFHYQVAGSSAGFPLRISRTLCSAAKRSAARAAESARITA